MCSMCISILLSIRLLRHRPDYCVRRVCKDSEFKLNFMFNRNATSRRHHHDVKRETRLPLPRGRYVEPGCQAWKTGISRSSSRKQARSCLRKRPKEPRIFDPYLKVFHSNLLREICCLRSREGLMYKPYD